MVRFLISAAYVLGVATTAVLAGCNGAASPISPATSMQDQSRGMDATAQRSWMSAEAKHVDLLYVADLGTNDVTAYSYPFAKLEGRLTGFEAVHYECVDKAGDVFVVNSGGSNIIEYAHGGTTPIATLSDPGFNPNSCTVDPTTGNLAVTQNSLGNAAGSILVYRHARGTPAVYSTPNVFHYYFSDYDARGNLFVDGTDMQVAFEFAELPAGSKTTKVGTLNQPIVLPGAIQWDGQHLAVGDQVSIFGPSTMYEFSMSGSTGTLVGTTPMSNSCDVLQFWLFRKKVIAANECSSNVMYFDYPAGGTATKIIGGRLSQPVGVTVSPAH